MTRASRGAPGEDCGAVAAGAAGPGSGADAGAAILPAQDMAVLRLEFCLPREDIPLVPGTLPPELRRRRAKPQLVRMIWHDSATEPMAPRRALCELRLDRIETVWRLEDAAPSRRTEWGAAVLPPVLAEGAVPLFAGFTVPDGLAPAAAFRGTRQVWQDGALVATLLDGVLHGVAEERPACRLQIEGEAGDVAGLARLLALRVRLAPPLATLAMEALSLGGAPMARHLGAPDVPAGLTVEQAFCVVLRHLADVVQHWSALVVAPEQQGFSPVAVHQARVACRRLRSALSLFRRAADSPELRSLATGLQELAATLGSARDWDVFLAGPAASIQATMPEGRGVVRLVQSATRRRGLAYRSLCETLLAVRWRQLRLELALAPELRPWREAAPAERLALLDSPVEAYARRTLGHAMGAMLRSGKDVAALSEEQRHDLRKAGKKLRYAVEIFGPQYESRGVRRTLKRLAVLQEALGALTDGAVAARLLDELGSAGGRFAGGAVLGWLAATAAPAAEAANQAWRRLRHAEPFWR